jgi:hypothetical protein
LGVRDFEKILRQEVEEIVGDFGWDFDNQAQRGYAFQYWVANVLCDYDRGFDTEPEDAILFSHDLKADLVLEDPNRQHLLITQCKFPSPAKKPNIDESEVNDFFKRHERFMDRAWVMQYGSAAAIEALGDYKDKVHQGYSVHYYFISTGKASDRTKELVDGCNKDYTNQGLRIECELLDFYGLKDYYVRSRTLEERIPDKIELMLPAGQYFEKNDPYPTVVAVLKGNALRALYKKYKESLFAWNIRGYLGSRGINEEIISSANNVPLDFFYFNNGISAICTKYYFQNDKLVAENFQIINGAQSVGALGIAEANAEIEVLFRLTRTKAVKTETGINRDIIKYNNSQNIIKYSDFRSNDQIQMWMEKKLAERKAQGPLPKLYYGRKRGFSRKGRGARTITLEELAKIRYSFLVEPTLVHSSPKTLWTHYTEGGAYEKSFGIDGNIPELWPQEEIERCFLAIAFYLAIEGEAKKETKENPDMRFLFRLRFHALRLSNIYYMDFLKEQPNINKLLKEKDTFDELWGEFWPDARRALITVHEQAIMNEDSTMFALVRSGDRWGSMERVFLKYIGYTPKLQ